MVDDSLKGIDKDVIFYDGPCGLCNIFVRFVLRRDPIQRFVFATLQSRVASRMLSLKGAPDSVVLMTKEGIILVKSDAVARVLLGLAMPWPMLGTTMKIVPAALRNWAYDFVALRRTRFFGRFDNCPLPKPEWKNRFLDFE